MVKLGRTGDALQLTWTEFEAHPSTFTYEELMRYVPAKEKMAWHQKAMQASERGDLSSQIELYLEPPFLASANAQDFSYYFLVFSLNSYLCF